MEKDNAVVTVGFTIYGKDLQKKVKRWSRKHYKHILVPIPHAVAYYNKHIGGTDQMDQNINAYRIGIKGKKWWWCLFT